MTPRSSQRAFAQEIYREMAVASPQTSLIPAKAGIQGQDGNASPCNPGSPLARGRADEEPSLTQKARALYEGAAVPVAEIAAACGVTERTIYKYAARENWTPRYRWSAAGGRPRGARWRAGDGFAPSKGAAGRFIRRADKDKPFATGLHAADPRAAALATAACAAAEARARAAEEEAESDALWREYNLASKGTLDMLEEITAYDKAYRQQHGVAPPADDAMGAAFAAALRAYNEWRHDVFQEIRSHWQKRAGG